MAGEAPSMTEAREYDVVVVGGGNAALCAALTAREAGASVVVLERAPREFRGGNSRHTRNLRCAHDAPTGVLTGSYSEDEFFADLLRVNANETDESLARLLICRSKTCTEWMSKYGVRFQSALRGTLHLSRTNLFFLGGGKALMNAYYAAAERMGIEVLYDAEVVSIDVREGSVRLRPDQTVRAKSLVLASGGFESNLVWLKEAWGDAADNFIVRGTPYNTGAPLRALLDAGAQPIGDPRACHAIAVDARAPKFDGGIVTRLDCIRSASSVNQTRRAVRGRRAGPLAQALRELGHTRRATALDKSPIASSTRRPPTCSCRRCFRLRRQHDFQSSPSNLGCRRIAVGDTVARFNDAVRPGTFDLEVLDDCQTHGLTSEKSHWAQRLDTPRHTGAIP
jgi:tricarballylate dehydrogenase